MSLLKKTTLPCHTPEFHTPDHSARMHFLNTMVGHLNEMTPKVDSDQTLPQERAKYDPIVSAEVVVGVWIALWALVHSLPRGLPAPVPRGLATSQLCGGCSAGQI